MLPEIELLQYIHKTAEMGCQGILTVLEHTKDTPLHQVLEEQRAEYQKLGREAERLLSARGEAGRYCQNLLRGDGSRADVAE